MASILTNTSAMVALQNLRTINSNLVDAQNQISTGKKISSATDNSLLLVCRPEKPHQQKESHHRSHEVSIGNFPGTPMMSARNDFLSLDNDRRIGCSGHRSPQNIAPRPLLLPPLKQRVNCGNRRSSRRWPLESHPALNYCIRSTHMEERPRDQTQVALTRMVQQS